MVDVTQLTSKLEASLQSTLGDPRLRLQLQQQNNTLYLIVNRSADSTLDYTTLTQVLQANIPRADLPDIATLQFYSRPFGQEQPDWSQQVQLPDHASLTADRLRDVKELIHRTTNIPSSQIRVKEKGDALLVLFNRPDSAPLNYQAITQSVQAAVSSLQLEHYSSLNLFSRAPGERKPDWSKKLNLVAAALPFPPTRVKPKGYSSSSSAEQTRIVILNTAVSEQTGTEQTAAVAPPTPSPLDNEEEPSSPPPPSCKLTSNRRANIIRATGSNPLQFLFCEQSAVTNLQTS